MVWVFVLAVVACLLAVAVVAAGHGGAYPEADPDRPAFALPEGEIGAEELRQVQFTTSLRGYRASEVDALIARLVAQQESNTTRG